MTETLKNMRHFFKQSKLSMIIQTFLFNQYNKEDTSRLEKVFKSMDKNDDGVLTQEEIEMAIRSHRLSPENSMLMEELLKTLSEKSPFINYTEFIVAASGKRNVLCNERIDEAFKMIDVDSSGKIDAKELHHVVRGAEMADL